LGISLGKEEVLVCRALRIRGRVERNLSSREKKCQLGEEERHGGDKWGGMVKREASQLRGTHGVNGVVAETSLSLGKSAERRRRV